MDNKTNNQSSGTSNSVASVLGGTTSETNLSFIEDTQTIDHTSNNNSNQDLSNQNNTLTLEPDGLESQAVSFNAPIGQTLSGTTDSPGAGDTTYGFNSTASDDDFDFTINTAPNVTITDTGGIDTLDLSGFTVSQVIRMDAGAVSNIGGLKKNLTIAEDTDIENVIGGTKRDTVYTNDLDNHILGGGGGDRFYASLGDDTLDGETGTDRVYYNYDITDFIISIVNSTTLTFQNTVDNFTDTLISIERYYFNGTLYSKDEVIATLNIDGSSDNDTIIGDVASNILDGGAGNDTLEGGGGNDILIGGAGIDTINGGTGTDTVDYSSNTQAVAANLVGNWGDENGGGGVEDNFISIENIIGTGFADILHGGVTANNIQGGNGNDDIRGNAGNDVLYGGGGSDFISGNDDDDTIYGDGGRDNLLGDGGNDTIYGGGGNDRIQGHDGNDILHGENGSDIIHGMEGNDTLSGGDRNDTLHGGSGDDTYIFTIGDDYDVVFEENGAGNDTLRITGGITASQVTAFVEADRAYVIQLSDGSRVEINAHATANGGTNAVNRIETIQFDDGTTWDISSGLVIQGRDTSHTLYGSDLDDLIDGNGGDDVLIAGNGDDTVNGGIGNDTVYGGNGADTINGDDGADTLRGDAGDDTINGGIGDDIIYGGAGEDTLNGDDGNDWIFAGAGNDIMHGGGGDDRLNGEDNNDVIYGDDGADIIYGGSGDDTLYGGDGWDALFGQAGADAFIFEVESAFNHVDNIVDFSSSDGDTIDITDLLSAYDSQSDLIVDFVEITDNGTHSFLAVDVDGGGDNFVRVAQISFNTGLTDEATLVGSGHLIV